MSHWYSIQTQANYEKKVAEEIQNRINKRIPALANIEEIFYPEETVLEHKNGKSIEKRRRLLPNYLFVKANYVDGIWHALKDIRGFQGFVGTKENPAKVPERQIEHLRKSVEVAPVKPKVVFEKGSLVRVTNGAFNDYVGTVNSVDYERNRIKVSISVFGRETPVELSMLDVIHEA